MVQEKGSVLYLGNKLMAHGFTPTSIETLGQLLESQYSMRFASSFRNPLWRLLHMLWVLVRFRKSTQVVLIDTYSALAFHYAWLTGLLSKWLKLPYIPILRGGDLPHRQMRSPRLMARFLNQAFATVVPSGYLWEHFASQYPRCVFLPNNIPLRNYSFKMRQNLCPRLLYVRAFHQIYNPAMAIKVLARLAETYPKARLCMIGPDKDGTLADVMSLARALAVEGRLEITGRLAKQAWIEKSVDWDIFINTTDFDNHPVSVTEAMALGLPVVSTNAGGLPNLIQHQVEGLLVNCGDVEAMVASIKTLLDHPDQAVTMAMNARQKVEAFDWDRLKFRWFQLIDDAIAGKFKKETEAFKP